MRLIFSILTGIVVIIAALVFVGPMFVSTEGLRNQLFARVESMTGYRLRVSGPVEFSLFPSIDLVVEDVGVGVCGRQVAHHRQRRRGFRIVPGSMDTSPIRPGLMAWRSRRAVPMEEGSRMASELSPEFRWLRQSTSLIVGAGAAIWEIRPDESGATQSGFLLGARRAHASRRILTTTDDAYRSITPRCHAVSRDRL